MNFFCLLVVQIITQAIKKERDVMIEFIRDWKLLKEDEISRINPHSTGFVSIGHFRDGDPHEPVPIFTKHGRVASILNWMMFHPVILRYCELHSISIEELHFCYVPATIGTAFHPAKMSQTVMN